MLGLEPRQAIARGLVSAVMQTGGLIKDLSVRETVAYTASLFADSRPVDEVLENAGITGIADRKVAKCSGGEQQRLRFAMALLSDPALLLLDEPTTGMDVEGRRTFWSAIRRDAEQGRTVLFATHYLEEADQYADRIVLISQGRIVADGSGSEIRALAAGRDGPSHARPTPTPTASRATRRRRRRRGPRRDRAGARQGQRRRGPLPADRDRRPGPGDHLQGSRGRLPEPDPRGEADEHRDEHRHHRPHHPQGPAVRRLQHHDPRDRAASGCSATAARSSSRWCSRPRCSSRSAAATGWNDDAGHGNVAAYIMVSMALYGAALTAAVGRRHGRHGAGAWAGPASSG